MPSVAVQTIETPASKDLGVIFDHLTLTELKKCLYHILLYCQKEGTQDGKALSNCVEEAQAILANLESQNVSCTDRAQHSATEPVGTATIYSGDQLGVESQSVVQKQEFAMLTNSPEAILSTCLDDDLLSSSSDSLSSDSEYLDDYMLLPPLPSTEPKLLKYHRESEEIALPNLVLTPPDRGPPCLSQNCEFCGQPLDSDSSNSDSDSSCSSHEESSASIEYCCRDRKRFVQLVLKYSKKLSTPSKGKVDRIDISPGKKALKSVAKERALARLKARKLQKQKELKLLGIGGSKVLQSSSFYSLARQTKTINFSLSEVNAVQETWIREKNSPGSDFSEGQCISAKKNLPCKPVKRQRRKKAVEDEEDDLLFWLRQQEKTRHPLLALKIVWYNEHGNSIFRICHRDGSGQCYYPSGNVALVVAAISPGVYSTMVLTDDVSSKQGLLAYFDDLGRGFCNYEKDAQIRLSYGGKEGCVLTEKGFARKNWLWSDDSAFVQPMLLNINPYITLKVVNQANLLLTMTVQPQFVAKFQVGRKLSPPMIQDGSFKDLEEFSECLKGAKTQLMLLLERLQGAVKRGAASKTSPERQGTRQLFLPLLGQKQASVPSSSTKKKKVMF